jgi:hypothetical protein
MTKSSPPSSPTSTRSPSERSALDENFPADFAALLAGHEASNVDSHGWAGIKNGELLRRAYGVCEVFVTLDRNLEFQQNIKILPYGIVVVRSAPIA